ncbi:MAG: spike base protein, RCAP_Rcc01079 family [Pikeienuella sp.]
MSENTYSATRIAAITPSDTVSIEPFPVALFIGGAGDIVVEAVDGGSASFTVPAGYMLYVQAVKVLSTGTTATNIVALYNN